MFEHDGAFNTDDVVVQGKRHWIHLERNRSYSFEYLMFTCSTCCSLF